MLHPILDNRLYLAPPGDNIQNVLDISTGTEIWLVLFCSGSPSGLQSVSVSAIDFADQQPSASVMGTDIPPIQPSVATKIQSEVPENTVVAVLTLLSRWFQLISDSDSTTLSSSGHTITDLTSFIFAAS
ncbi:hypothetical protein WAI453_000839 [Rhynchosporium graminicola]